MDRKQVLNSLYVVLIILFILWESNVIHVSEE